MQLQYTEAMGARSSPHLAPPTRLLPAAEFQQYGGFDFHTQKPAVDVFVGSKGVEFWVQSQAGLPDMVFRLGNILGVSKLCGGAAWRAVPSCSKR